MAPQSSEISLLIDCSVWKKQSEPNGDALDCEAILINKNTMRAHEFITEDIAPGFQVYSARVRVKNPLYNTSIDVAVFAKSPAMARLLLQAQYGADSVVTNVQKIS